LDLQEKYPPPKYRISHAHFAAGKQYTSEGVSELGNHFRRTGRVYVLKGRLVFSASNLSGGKIKLSEGDQYDFFEGHYRISRGVCEDIEFATVYNLEKLMGVLPDEPAL